MAVSDVPVKAKTFVIAAIIIAAVVLIGVFAWITIGGTDPSVKDNSAARDAVAKGTMTGQTGPALH